MYTRPAVDNAVTPKPASVAPAKGLPSDQLYKSDLFQAYVGAITELSSVFNNLGKNKAELAKLNDFQFSSGTKKKLLVVFGTENPLHIKSEQQADGSTDVQFNLDKLNYLSPEKTVHVNVAELTGKATFNKAKNKVQSEASLPFLSFEITDTARIVVNDMNLTATHTKTASGLWLGRAVFKVDQMNFGDKQGAQIVKIDKMVVSAEVKPQGKNVSLAYDYAIKSVSWGKDSLDAIHLGINMSNIDGKALATFSEKAKKNNESTQSVEDRMIASRSLVTEFGLAILQRGAVVNIEDISAQYHGLTAGLSGVVSFPNMQKKDMESAKSFSQKVKAHLDFHMPVALATEVARLFARTTMQAKNKGAEVAEKDVESTAKAMVDKMTQELIKNKWIKIEHDIILSSLDFNKGKLSINGTAVPLGGSK